MHYKDNVLCIHSSFAIILKRKRKLVALQLLSYRCIVTVNVLWLFLTVPWDGLQCVIVGFPDQTHLLLNEQVLKEFLLSVKAATLIHVFLSGRGSAIPSAKEGKTGLIYNLVKS